MALLCSSGGDGWFGMHLQERGLKNEDVCRTLNFLTAAGYSKSHL